MTKRPILSLQDQLATLPEAIHATYATIHANLFKFVRNDGGLVGYEDFVEAQQRAGIDQNHCRAALSLFCKSGAVRFVRRNLCWYLSFKTQ